MVAFFSSLDSTQHSPNSRPLRSTSSADWDSTNHEQKSLTLAFCCGRHLFGSYLAAVTDFTEIVSPVAVPVTLASSQASLLSVSSAA
jgi:hypothetical protein